MASVVYARTKYALTMRRIWYCILLEGEEDEDNDEEGGEARELRSSIVRIKSSCL